MTAMSARLSDENKGANSGAARTFNATTAMSSRRACSDLGRDVQENAWVWWRVFQVDTVAAIAEVCG